jgi:signal transduction histidine kinase
MNRLIEDLTLLARLDQPEFDLRIETVEVGGHVTEIVEAHRRKAEEAGVTLAADATETVEVETDPERLAQIVQNLLENALRFTPEAGKVVVTVRPADDGVDVEVADNGLGIDAEDLPHIFDRHYVGRQRRIRNEGSGLGLSIVKGLTERLGGTVTAESTPGKGTIVTVRLT